MYGRADGIENPISHVPSRQPRRTFEPRADLAGEYSPYWDGKSPKPFGDKTINADLGTLYETDEERKKRMEAKKPEAEKARRKYLARLRQDESNDKRDSVPSDMGFGKAGEADTDGDAPDPDEQNDDPLDGFQIIAPANKDIIQRRQAKIDLDIAEGRLGTTEDPAPALITLDEQDHLVGVGDEVQDFSDPNEPLLEEEFEKVKVRKLLTKVNIERGGRVYDTNIDIDRISNHRQKDWLRHHGGEDRVCDIWDNASFVEVMVRPHGETQVVIHAAAKTGEKIGQELRLDADDFFAMFSIPDVSDGDSRFQYKNFKLNSPADEIRIKTFFEKVTVNGKKIGAKKEGTSTIIKITSWEPREATKTQKDLGAGKPVGFKNDYYGSNEIPKPWNDVNLNGNAFDDPMWPKSVEQESKNKNAQLTEEQNIKRLRKRLAEEEQYRKDRLIAHLNRLIDRAQDENRKIEI